MNPATLILLCAALTCITAGALFADRVLSKTSNTYRLACMAGADCEGM